MMVAPCPECRKDTSVETAIRTSDGLTAVELGCGHAVKMEWLEGAEMEEPLYKPHEYHP
jgi:hypothetical protein